MSDQVKVVLDGAKEAQQANLRTMSQLSPSGRGGRAVFYMISDLWAYAVRITHRDTTALALAHRMQVKGNRGEVYLDPDAQNPRPQGPRQTKPYPTPAVYGVLTATRTSPETMVMPVATNFDSTTNAAVIAGYLGVGGYDTWDPANWTSGATIPGDLTMVVVLGGDWASRLVGPVLPEPTTTTEYLPPDQAIQTTTIGCLIGTYTVVEGDAPSTVAAKLDVTLQDLVLANEDNPDFASFFVGAVINVPDLAC